MAQTQNTNLIRIDTIFNDLDPPTAADGDDPLLLTKVTGSEAMSSPFLYEVTMVRPLDRDKRIPLDPAKLIDTVARIGVGLEPPSGLIHEATPQRWILRGGVFQSIESLGIATLQRVRHYRVYRAVIVPPFTMMQREIAFRIFENENPATIIKDMLASFPHMEFNDDIMSCTVFPDLTYCVQYQEDSFNFLSRLMARFGIWYFFDHLVQDAAGLQADLQQHKPLRCSKMVLGGPDKAFLKSAFKPCAWFPSPTVIRKPTPAVSEVASFIVQSQPASQFFRVGDFNQLAPTKPAHGDTPVGNDLDLINPKFDASDSDGTKTRFQQTGFPVPERNNKDAKSSSDVAMSAQEAGVTIVTGATKNRSFATGFSFTVSKDEDDPDEVHRQFIITLVNLAAYDHTIGANVGTGLAAFAFDWLIGPFEDFVNGIADFFGKLVGRKQTRVFTGAVNDPNPDFILAMAGAGFNNIAKNQLQAAFQPTKPGSVPSSSNPAATSSQAALYSNENYFGAGALAQIASFMPYFFKVLTSGFQELGEQIAGVDCSINFAAVPSNVPIVPLPAGVRALVRGPHLATVIGPNGALKADGSDATGVFHDALGRVRIRFPWDRGPPDPNDAAGKVAPPAKTRDPLKTADNTCWVRVTQGWAGRGRGIQFLPRIGEEVIVDFLDGDPDRPIITGRVYNADESFANLPFPADDRHKDPKAVSIPADHLTNPKPPTTSGFTRSGIKTTTLRNGEEVPTRFHLLRFDDDSAREQVLLRSQHRLDITAFEKRYESIHSDRHLTVGGKWTQPTPGIAGDYIAHVFKDYHLHVGDASHPTDSGNRTTLIEQNDRIKVVKNSDQAIGGDWSTGVGGQATIDANGLAGKIVLNAITNITLTVGGSSIVITPASIAITSPMVLINSGGPPPAPPIDPNVDPPKDPTPADPGDTQTPPK